MPFLKPVNEVFARHRLNICQQKVGESLEEFLQRLKTLSAECNFRAVTTAQNQEAAIRDAFIAGLSSGYTVYVTDFWRMRPWSFKLSSIKLDHSMMLSEMQKFTQIYSSRSEVTSGTPALCETSSETEMRSELECLAVKRLQCF